MALTKQSLATEMVVSRGDRPAKPRATDHRQPASVRKAQIVQAALRLVGELGLAGVGVARIARAVGITDAALYKHFRSREEILLAVHQRLSERVFAWLKSAQAPNPVDRLRELGEVHASYLSTDVEYFNAPMFQYNSWICRDAVYEQVAKGREETRRWLMNLVEDGKARGCIRSGIDTDLLVAEVLAWIWWEDLSYLQDREKEWAAGTSAAMFAAILDRISVPDPASAMASSPTALVNLASLRRPQDEVSMHNEIPVVSHCSHEEGSYGSGADGSDCGHEKREDKSVLRDPEFGEQTELG